MHVVLIDDDEDLSFATSLALRAGGFQPTVFGDCDAAAEALAKGDVRPDAVLMDVHLGGGMQPRDFIVWLREHDFPNVPVVLVSAATDLPEVARAMGAQGYIRKPFDVADLVKRVAQARSV